MPKARKSSPIRRQIRFREKYQHRTVPLRFKVYLPRMNELINTELINLDELERQIYDKLDSLGTPSNLYPFYMAFAKRCFETYLQFSDVTAEEEVGLLKQEFILRLLDSATLDQLATICKAKAEIVKAS